MSWNPVPLGPLTVSRLPLSDTMRSPDWLNSAGVSGPFFNPTTGSAAESESVNLTPNPLRYKEISHA